MSLMQRLTADENIGFNYDYMGYAEFEFGATSRSRVFLANCWMNNKITARKICMDVSKRPTNYKMIMIGETGYVNSFTSKEVEAFHLHPDKTGLRFENEEIIGWMTVQSRSPLLFIRDNNNVDASLERLEKFLKPAVEQIKKDPKILVEWDIA